MIRRLTSLCCFWFALGHLGCFAQTVELQPDAVEAGDVALLIIEFEDSVPALPPLDTSVLEHDFEVLSVESGVRKIIQSGYMTHRMRWEIELFPRRAGDLPIPPLSIKGKMTPGLVLTVRSRREEEAAGNRSNGDVFVELSAEPTDPYIGRQTDIMIKLFHARRIVSGRLSEPAIDGLDIFRNVSKRHYGRTINGRDYKVQEQTVAVFPDSAGELRIPPVTFLGVVARRAPDTLTGAESLFRPTKRIKRDSNALVLQVRDIPEQYTGRYWLPARQLDIHQQWIHGDGKLTVGDSLIRRLIVTADGLPAKALPELLFTANDGFSVYPAQAKPSNDYVGKTLTGSYRQQYAIVFSSPGTIAIPELRLTWWDVEQQAARTSVAPARQFTISPAPGDPAVHNATPANRFDGKPAHSEFQARQWLALVGTLLALIALIAWAKTRFSTAGERSQSAPRCHFSQRALKQACRRNDPAAARAQLIAWGRKKRGGNCFGLQALMHSAEAKPFISELARLDAALYSDTGEPWRGGALWQSFVAERRASRSRAAAGVSGLPPLYPADEFFYHKAR